MCWAPTGRFSQDSPSRWNEGAVDSTNLHLAETRAPGSRCTLLRLSELLFVEVVRRSVDEVFQPPRGWIAGLRDPVVGRCLILMHGRPAEPWTLQSLAHAAGCSRSSLAERFAELIGDPPIRHLTRWRMQLAANLLERERLTVEAVGHRVGYGSGAAFSRAFQREVGMSPTEWREKLSRPAADGSSSGSNE